MMKYLASLAFFCISTANAVRHYGIMPAMDANGLMEDSGQIFSDDDVQLVSRFRGNNDNIQDGYDFLANELGIFNKTIHEVFAPSTLGVRGLGLDLETRDGITGKCTGHGDIKDNLSNLQIKMICGGMAHAANGGVSTIIDVIESKLCTAAGTGHPIPSCKTVLGYIKVSGSGFTATEIYEFCPQFLSLFVKCQGHDAQGHAQGDKIEMNAFNSQKDYNCENVNGEDDECIEQSVG